MYVSFRIHSCHRKSLVHKICWIVTKKTYKFSVESFAMLSFLPSIFFTYLLGKECDWIFKTKKNQSWWSVRGDFFLFCFEIEEFGQKEGTFGGRDISKIWKNPTKNFAMDGRNCHFCPFPLLMGTHQWEGRYKDTTKWHFIRPVFFSSKSYEGHYEK